jgi:uncharacterized membrane protein YhaH (DUF805 family)
MVKRPNIIGLSCEGRIGRLRYALGKIVIAIPYAILTSILVNVSSMKYSYSYFHKDTSNLDGLIAILVVLILVCLVFSMRLEILRLHDINTSGAVILVALPAFIMGLVLSTRNPDDVSDEAGIIFGILLLVALIYGLILLFKAGTKGDNDYGTMPYKLSQNSLVSSVKEKVSKIELPYKIEVTATKNNPKPAVTPDKIPNDLESLSKEELDMAISALQKLSKGKG